MPTFSNPKWVHVEPRGSGGGGLAAAAVVVVAGGAGAIWLVREVLRAWIELTVIIGGTAVIMGTLAVLAVVQVRRGQGRVDAQIAAWRAESTAKPVAAAAAPRPAIAAPVTVTVTHSEVHHHYDERQLHIHQAPPAAEPRPAIAAPKVVPGQVLGATAPEAIEARRLPLHRITSSKHEAIEENKR